VFTARESAELVERSFRDWCNTDYGTPEEAAAMARLAALGTNPNLTEDYRLIVQMKAQGACRHTDEIRRAWLEQEHAKGRLDR
jgi:hypothetical protein